MNSTLSSVTGMKLSDSWSTPSTPIGEDDSCWTKERCRYWIGILIAYTLCLVVFIICSAISRKYFKLYELEASRQHNPIEVRDGVKTKCSVLPPIKVGPSIPPKPIVSKSDVVTIA